MQEALDIAGAPLRRVREAPADGAGKRSFKAQPSASLACGLWQQGPVLLVLVQDTDGDPLPCAAT